MPYARRRISVSERMGDGKQGHPYVAGRPSRNRVIHTKRDLDAVERECPSCGWRVPQRKDGTLISHRIGTSMKNSYPCPGEDKGTL